MPSSYAHVRSPDGTLIAYERAGRGPALVLVGGGLDDGSENEPLAAALAASFTTCNYARRGRGASGDVQPYAVEREIEDLAALIAAAGGRAHLVGISSGGMFALEAAAAGLPVDSVTLYEVPYDTSDEATGSNDAYREELAALLADNRRGDAVELFMRLAGSAPDQIVAARAAPVWPALEALAHTLAYDAALYGPPPTDHLATIGQPTLVATGGGADFFESSGDAVAAALPNARRLVLQDQGHIVDPATMSAVVRDFVGRVTAG